MLECLAYEVLGSSDLENCTFTSMIIRCAISSSSSVFQVQILQNIACQLTFRRSVQLAKIRQVLQSLQDRNIGFLNILLVENILNLYNAKYLYLNILEVFVCLFVWLLNGVL